ncbi:MAG TPA: SRPBCC domain-containing protein [Solirubrobacteraceae bacterium]|nr:SRPBCC domain-containing protein [Solirubrobacteraceae bacterium]
MELPAPDLVVIRRAFAAPPPLVWRAITEPALVSRWWPAGGHGTMRTCEIDLRVGGRWRYVMDLPEGGEVAFRGEYLELAEAERIVSTEAYEFAGFEDVPESYTTNTIMLAATVDGGTGLETVVRCTSPEQRDAIIASGMEAGMQRSFDALDEVAASLA